ncbi:hypothetical protein BDL97_06G022200 [Sphagnum fallax]|nr:hypothetical protein BDL97_06G022200 [Sphagnum fallax]KAH8958405.1 hypothetical protein BDL97_06G022200 [Sphagnum fallax]
MPRKPRKPKPEGSGSSEGASSSGTTTTSAPPPAAALPSPVNPGRVGTGVAPREVAAALPSPVNPGRVGTGVAPREVAAALPSPVNPGRVGTGVGPREVAAAHVQPSRPVQQFFGTQGRPSDIGSAPGSGRSRGGRSLPGRGRGSGRATTSVGSEFPSRTGPSATRPLHSRQGQPAPHYVQQLPERPVQAAAAQRPQVSQPIPARISVDTSLGQLAHSPPPGAEPSAATTGAGAQRLVEQIGSIRIAQESSVPVDEEQQQAVVAVAPAPVSSKTLRFPLRPGKGRSGQHCMVKANHFIANLPDKDLHHYDVAITPEVTSRGVNRAVMEQLVKRHRESDLANRLPAYDGRKSLYTAGKLPFESREFQIALPDEDDGGNTTIRLRRERAFKVVIKFASRPDLHHLRQFLAGAQADAPQEALQVLDIVLRELPTHRYTPIVRSFYSPNLGSRVSLGDGLESWRGFYQSIRPTQMGLSLNIDMSSTAFIEPKPVLDFIHDLCNRHVSGPLSDFDRSKIKKALHGVKVEVIHRGSMRRKYRIAGLTKEATEDLQFPVDEKGTLKSVTDYFRETYKFSIRYPKLPCLQVGNQQRPNYLPMEVCKIAEGQRYSKRLNDRQITALLKVTCQRPRDRENDILQTVGHNAYHQDPYAQEFGIRISNQLANVEARILPAPRLKYHDTGREKECLPSVGQWNMMNKKMVNGGVVRHWACINFSRSVGDDLSGRFCYELARMCETSGMVFEIKPICPVQSVRPDYSDRAISHVCELAKKRTDNKGLDLLIAILDDSNGSLYGDLKKQCETVVGVVSQCCLTKHVHKINKQYLANVALKINVKVGGRNTVLVDALSRRIPLVSDIPTIIFGADVTHPHPGEDTSPSIAAVVASQDWPEVTKYAGLVCAQAHRQELIQDLYKTWVDPQKGILTGGLIKELLISFWRATGQKPLRIIFYRDGVSEGQFYQVLLYELDAIRKACASLEPEYQPPVTFVVVQKRHHTRLFASNHNDTRSVDKSGNILPGTVVDSKICHPTEFDFYLCSHAGIQGTSRPAHYHVLWDENKFTADGLQSLTNNLCYTATCLLCTLGSISC